MQAGFCPPFHQILNVAPPSPTFTYSFEHGDNEPSRFCLTCFLASLQLSRSSLSFPSLADVQQGTVAVLTGLTQQCPSDTEKNGNGNSRSKNNEVLRRWVLDALDLSVNTAADFSESDAVMNHQNFGWVLAEIVVALYRFLIHNTDVDSSTAATKLFQNANNKSTNNSQNSIGCRAAFVELVVFLFAGWELLLFPNGVHQQRSLLSSPKQQFFPTRLDRRQASSNTFSTDVLSGERYGSSLHQPYTFTFREDDVDTCFSPVHHTAILHAISTIVERLVGVVLELRLSADAGELTLSGSTHEQQHSRCYVAAALLRSLVQQAPLLNRTLLTSGHVCALARLALPSFIDICVHRVPLKARKRFRGCDLKCGCASTADASAPEHEPSDALYLLLYVVFTVLREHKSCLAATVNGVVQRISASQPAVWRASSAAAAATAATDGTPFLLTLLWLLKLPQSLQPSLSSSRLTPLVLMVLGELLTWPATRTRLLQLPRSAVATESPITASPTGGEKQTETKGGENIFQSKTMVLGEETEEASALHEGHSFSSLSSTTFISVELAVTLGPLLLHPSGEVVRLSSEVITQLIDCPVILDRDAVAASQSAALAVAQQVEYYVVHALGSAAERKSVLCGVLVNLLERVAAVLEEEAARAEEALCESITFHPSLHASTTSTSREVLCAAEPDTEFIQGDVSEGWRVVFQVACVDVKLFEQLVCGAFFRHAIRSPTHQRRKSGNTASHNGGGNYDDEFHKGMDWNGLVQDAITTLLDTSARVSSQAFKAPPPLTLFSYLCFLHTLAVGMQAAIASIWPNSLMRLVHYLAERVEQCTAATGTAAIKNAVAADVSDIAFAVPLRSFLEPQTHLLLIQVTAAYLPYTETNLHRVALLLLRDLVLSSGLVSQQCSELIIPRALHAVPTVTTAEEEESRCLLQIATQLLHAHSELTRALRLTNKRTNREDGGVCPCCDGGNCSRQWSSNKRELSFLHNLCGLHPESNAPNLFDVLLDLHPDSTTLMDARAGFISAMMGRSAQSLVTLALIHTDEDEENTVHDNDPLAFVWMTSVHELLTSRNFEHKAELMLGLSQWSHRVAFADERVVASILHESVQRLADEMAETVQRMSGTVTIGADDLDTDPFDLQPLEHGYAAEHLTRPARRKQEKVCGALCRLVSVVIVCFRWCGGNTLFSLLTKPGKSTDLRIPATRRDDYMLTTTKGNLLGGADENRYSADNVGVGNEVALLETLMVYVEHSFMLRQGVCRFLFDVMLRHGVDVCQLLRSLNYQPDHQSYSPTASVLTGLFSGLGAALTLSAILYLRDITASSEEEEDTDASTDPFFWFVKSLVSSHWLTGAFGALCQTEKASQAADVSSTERVLGGPRRFTCLSGELLLTSLFRLVRASAASTTLTPASVNSTYIKISDDDNSDRHSDLNAHQGQGLSSQNNAYEGRKMTAVTCLRYLLAEAQYQLKLLLRQRVRGFDLTEVEPNGAERDESAWCNVSLVTRRFFGCLVSRHLAPFFSTALRNGSAFVPSMSTAAADKCTDLLQRLTCVSLWGLRSTDGSECDGVLTQYVLRYVRLCLGLTNAEVEASYAAAAAAGGDVLDTGETKREGIPDETGGLRIGRVLCIRNLVRLTLRLLQLLYLLLLRSNRAAVVVADSEAVLLFAATAHHASASKSACAKSGCADVHVLAAVVQLLMRRLQRGTRCRSSVGSPVATATGNDWYEKINLFAFQEQPSNFINSAAYRKRVWVLLAGVECILRLHPFEGGSLQRNATPQVVGATGGMRRLRGGSGDAEWRVVSLLLDWCYGVLVPSSSTMLFSRQQSRGGEGDAEREAVAVVDEDASGVMTAAARILYLLLHRCPSLITSTGGLDAFLITYCAGATSTMDERAAQYLVAQGWVLAALLDVLFCFPHWYLYARSVEIQVVRFFQRPAVLKVLKRAQIPAATASSGLASSTSAFPVDTNSASRQTNQDAGDLKCDEAQDQELCLLVLTLLDVIRTYERNVARCGKLSAAASGGPLLPSGVMNNNNSGSMMSLPGSHVNGDVGSTQWWMPYAIPTTENNDADSLPLLFVFNQLLC